MKRLITFLMVFVFALTLTACGRRNDDNMVNDAGNAVQDVTDGVGDAVQDVTEGVGNAVDEVTDPVKPDGDYAEDGVIDDMPEVMTNADSISQITS